MALGGVWAISYNSGVQCILADSYLPTPPHLLPDFNLLFPPGVQHTYIPTIVPVDS